MLRKIHVNPNFQISEVILGSLSIVLSCIYLAYVYGPNGYFCHDCYYTWNTGEGIWCGVWVR